MNPSKEYNPMPVPKYCYLPTCKNTSIKNPKKIFFAVPNSQKHEWCTAVGVECPKRPLHICEDDLNVEEDVENYQYWRMMKGRARLKSRLPQSLIHMSSRNIDQDINEPTPSTSSASQMTVDKGTNYENPIRCNKAVQVKIKTADRATSCAIKMLIKDKKKKEQELDRFMVESISTEETMPSTQGSTSSPDFSEVSSEVGVERGIQGRSFMLNLIERKPYAYLGLPKKYYWLISFIETELNVKSFNTIITLYKIKNNTPFFQIADVFEVSLTTLWRIFFKTLCILSQFFKQFIFSPSRLDVKRNLPSSFTINKEYSNVFCIIDCFEIEIEKPSDPIYQSLTWSQYKNANTLKYLLATTPDGLINFVSNGFGGRVSDSKIVEISGFLECLPSNCTILADRGFKHIDTILNQKQIKLLRPPSVLKDIKMSKQEAIKSKVIASLRIHVERVIRRIRMFKFLKPHSLINNKLVQYTDEAVIVACGLISLQDSIIKNQ